VVKEVHAAGGDLVVVAAVSEVGRRWRSAWGGHAGGGDPVVEVYIDVDDIC
jgi:hypothetical protein